MSILNRTTEEHPVLQSKQSTLLAEKQRAENDHNEPNKETKLDLEENYTSVILEQAKISLNQILVKNPGIKDKLKRMMMHQKTSEQRFKEKYISLQSSQSTTEEQLEACASECYTYLMSFQLRCLQNLRALKIPLFMNISKEISKDQKEMINYINEILK